MRARTQIPASSNFCRMLICAVCNADFVPVGRDRYGCAAHYRGKGCGNGKTLPRRMMEAGVIELLAETAIAVSKLKAAGDLGEDRKVQSRMQVNRCELGAVEARLGGLLTAIEDGFYSTRMKIRFQQLEDQADRLRATLEIDRDQLQSLTVRADNNPEKAVAAMVAELRATSDEYVIVKLRRMLEPIKVMLGLVRAQCALQWNEELNLSQATG